MAFNLGGLIGNKATQLNAKKDAQGRSIYGTAGWQGDRREEGYGGFLKGGQAYEQLGDDPSVWQHATYDPQYGYMAPLGKIGEMDLTKAPGGNLALAAILALSGGAAIGAMGAGGAAGAAGTGSGAITGGGAGGTLGGAGAASSVLSPGLQAALGEMTIPYAGANLATYGAGAIAPYAAAGAGGGLGLTSLLGGAGTALTAAQLASQQEVDGSAQSIYDAAAQGGIPGYDPELTSGTAQGGAPGSTYQLPNYNNPGNPSGTTFGIPNNLLSGLAQGVGGYLAADKQGDAYRDVANQYLNIGAPYRGYLNQSYQPGFDLASQPGYGDAFGRMADVSARSYSARMGNPADNPTAQAGILSDVWNQGYLPALSNYRGQLGQFGGLGLNTSGSASLQGAGTTGSGWEAIGAGIGTAMSPQNPLEDAARRYGLSIGGTPYRG